MCASAASIIAMAGDEIVMAPGATMMVHDPYGSLFAAGSDELRYAADLIDQQRAQMVDIYVARTGASAAEISAWMTSESYMDATTALERGFCDRIQEPAMKVCGMRDSHKQALARLLTLPASIEGRTPMPTPATPTATPPPPIDLNAARQEGAAAERLRIQAIQVECRRARLSDDFAAGLIASGRNPRSRSGRRLLTPGPRRWSAIPATGEAFPASPAAPPARWPTRWTLPSRPRSLARSGATR